VVVQCALAILLLAGAGLLLRSLGALRGMETGYRTANVPTMRVNASYTRYPQGPQLRQFYDQLLERVRVLPGVTNAAATTNLFLSNTPSSGTFTLEDRPPFPPSEQIEATIDTASPGFFEAIQVRLVHGRFLDAHDWENAPRAAVINETFANRYWPNQDPVGKHFVFGNSKPGPNESWITIVGVIGDMRRRGLHQGPRLEVFFPSGQNAARNMQLLIAGSGPPFALVPAVRAEIRALDQSAPVTEISTVEAEIGESLTVRRFQALLLSLFSVLAVLLAAVGIFGLMAQLVVRRTPEIGVRMALGATPQEVLKMVLRQGVLLAAVGAAAGLCGAFVVGRVLKSLLFGVSGRSHQLRGRNRRNDSRGIAGLWAACVASRPRGPNGGAAQRRIASDSSKDYSRLTAERRLIRFRRAEGRSVAPWRQGRSDLVECRSRERPSFTIGDYASSEKRPASKEPIFSTGKHGLAFLSAVVC